MANVKFNVACPSCEANLVIRSSAAVGRKMECPKCKYRFVVPQPSAADAEDEAVTQAAEETPAAEKKGKKKKKEKATKGNNKALLGVLLGVLVLGGLGFAAMQIFGGDDPKPAAQNNKNNNPSPQPQPGGPGGGEQPNPPTDPGKGDPDGPGRADPGTNPNPRPGGPNNPPPKPPKKKRLADPNSKDITNLLPGETQAVWHGRADELVKTPLYASFFNADLKQLFQDSMAFDVSEVREFVQCQVGLDRQPFAVLQTKNDLDADELVGKMKLGKPAPHQGRDVYPIQSNAFLAAVSKSLTLSAVLGGKKAAAAGPDKPLALCFFDRNTLMIGEKDNLERFLDELQPNGYPPYKTELTDTPPPPAPAPPTNPMPGGPGGPPLGVPTGPGGGPMGAPPGGPGAPPLTLPGTGKDNSQAPAGGQFAPRQQPRPGGEPGAPVQQPRPDGPGQPDGPAAPAAGGEPPPRFANFTSNPTFRTIDQNLKRALNQLEDEEKDPLPALTFVEIVNQRVMAERDFSAVVPDAGMIFVNSILSQAKVFGFSLTALNDRKMAASVYIDHETGEAAKTAAQTFIVPLLNAAKQFTKLPFDVNDRTSGQPQPGFPGGSGEGPGFPGGPSYPGGPGGSGFPVGPMKPPTSGPSIGGKSSSLPRNDRELAQKPGAPSAPGLPGGPAPGMPGMPGPGMPGMPGPGMPGMPGPGSSGGSTGSGSRIDVSLSATVVTLDFELVWGADTYANVVSPAISRTAAQVRGRMAVGSGAIDAFALAEAANKYAARTKQFPRGTIDRDARGERFGLPAAPGDRVSFFADLLPFIGKQALLSKIQSRKFAWHATENLPAAEEWVPEFLNPNYGEAAWRATSEQAPGRSLGATNYVGVAGLGLDAARYDPADPDQRKKVGLMTYDTGAALNDCPDGLSNTMLMVQLPPNANRPWIAGGGATLTGIEDSDDAFKSFVTKQADGKRGAMVLMGDGSVRFVREGVAPAAFKAMATRAGGEVIDDFDKTFPKLTPGRAAVAELRPVPKPPEPAVNPQPPEPKAGVDAEELKKFQGTWKPVLMLKGGTESPDQKNYPALRFVVTGTTFAFVEGDKKPDGITAVRLDAADGHLDFQRMGQPVMPGLYKFDGERLIITFGKERPKSTDKADAVAQSSWMELTRGK